MYFPPNFFEHVVSRGVARARPREPKRVRRACAIVRLSEQWRVGLVAPRPHTTGTAHSTDSRAGSMIRLQSPEPRQHRTLSYLCLAGRPNANPTMQPFSQAHAKAHASESVCARAVARIPQRPPVCVTVNPHVCHSLAFARRLASCLTCMVGIRSPRDSHSRACVHHRVVPADIGTACCS